MLEQLIGKGREVRVWDPHIRLDSIYGTNRAFLMNAVPHISRLLDSDLDRLLEWAGHLVLTQVPAPEVARRIESSGVPVLDLARA